MANLAKNIPKPLIDIEGKPILERIMDHYASYGVKDFVLCLGHLGEEIKNYFAKKPSSYNLIMVDTGEDSSKSERLLKVKNLLGDDELFFVSYGDDLGDVDISKLLEFHKNSGVIATLTAVRMRSDYGILDIGDNSLVEDFNEKPLLDKWINAGYFVFNRKIFDYIEKGGELEKEVFYNILKQKNLSAYKHEGFWKSINTPKDVLEAEELVRKNGSK